MKDKQEKALAIPTSAKAPKRTRKVEGLPTAGAMRAAEHLYYTYGHINESYRHRTWVDDAASRIDRESGLPELLAIGKKLLAIFDHPERSVTALDADELRAVIDKVEPRALSGKPD